MKSLSLFSTGLLLVAIGASAQDRGQAEQRSPANEPSAQSPYQPRPPSAQPSPAPEASSSNTFSGTVESVTEGKSMKIKMADGKTRRSS